MSKRVVQERKNKVATRVGEFTQAECVSKEREPKEDLSIGPSPGEEQGTSPATKVNFCKLYT